MVDCRTINTPQNSRVGWQAIKGSQSLKHICAVAMIGLCKEDLSLEKHVYLRRVIYHAYVGHVHACPRHGTPELGD